MYQKHSILDTLQTSVPALFLLCCFIVSLHFPASSKNLIGRSDSIKSAFPDSSIRMLSGLEDDMSLKDSVRFEVHRVLGYAHFYDGSFDSALYHLTSASLLEGLWVPERSMFQVENALGAVYQRFGDGKQAIDHYLRGLRLAERMNDTLAKAKIFNNLSILYRTSGDYRNAEVQARRALQIYEAARDTHFLAGSMNNLGLVKVAEEQYDSALVYYRKSLKLKQKSKDLRSMANTWNNIGIVYEAIDSLDNALYHYMEANSLRRQAGDRYGIASSCINIAGAYLAKGDVDQAWIYILEGETFSKFLGSTELFERLTILRSEYYEKKGRLSKALNEMRLLYEMRDSLIDNELYYDLAQAEFMAAASDARSNTERLKREGEAERKQLRLQRFVNLLMALAISLFIGMLALLLYQLSQLKRLRERLTNQRDEAEQRATARKETLQQAAHEIRTPINSIISLSGLLKGEPDEQERQKMLSILVDSSELLLKLVNNILSISRIEQGKVSRTLLPVELYAWVQKEIRVLEPLATAKGLNFTLTDAENEKFLIETDTDLLRQVVLNIVGNAIKFTAEGSVTVALSKRADHCVISVTDTGEGIPKQHIEYIFDAFYQAGSKTNEGSGLGLSIARQYTEELGGKIELTSEHGKGSEFRIVLPSDPKTENR